MSKEPEITRLHDVNRISGKMENKVNRAFLVCRAYPATGLARETFYGYTFISGQSKLFYADVQLALTAQCVFGAEKYILLGIEIIL